ncbi:MAG TPA: CheR family methyltransferase [Labilithrix sp.]
MAGSAGSLEPIGAFFSQIDSTVDAAFLVVTHRDPKAPTLMPEILARMTALPVRTLTDGALSAGNVYVVPADQSILSSEGRFTLAPRAKGSRGGTIDAVLRAVADGYGDATIGVLLSGMGSDGTAGLRAVRDAFGLVLVQDPATAAYDEMPKSAIDARLADVVGPPEKLAESVVAHCASHARGAASGVSLDRVLEIVRVRTGHDFASYKPGTIERRVERRLRANRLDDVAAYVRLLERDPDEAQKLFDDLLIGVTRFFRGPEVFEALAATALPALLAVRRGDRPLRVWVPGCATGEEAYSLAMLLTECWEARGEREPLRLQIYGTDLDKEAITKARAGFYPASIAADVSPARLARFFIAEEGGYRVKKHLRQSLVFAVQNVVSDPPFTKIDLLSCRNVLIYLKPELQQKLLPLFFLALVPGGILVLGASESISGLGDAFAPLDSRSKIFRRSESALGLQRMIDFPVRRGLGAAIGGARAKAADARPLEAEVARAIAAHVAPPVLVVTAKGELVYASQRVGRWLEPPAGKASTNVYAMARDGLGVPLRLAIRRAIDRGEKVVEKGVRVGTAGKSRTIDLVVQPFDDGGPLAGCVLVALEEQKPSPKRSAGSNRATADLAAELASTRAQIDELMTAMERSNEQLETTNEELQSANEELQSTNEEMTTSKEEMQSMNEELLTLNAELQEKNEQLGTANDDMRNLLDSSQIPTLFLDRELRLKRFTARASKLGNLRPSDVGRPITDINLSIRDLDIGRDVRRVLETLVFHEAQVKSRDGSSYTMRIHPYRTMDDLIDGVVITFLDVTVFERARAEAATTERERLLVRLVDRWPGVAWAEDTTTGRALVVSQTARDALGYGAAAPASAEAWLALRHPDDRAAESAAPFRLRCADGSYRRFAADALPIGARADGAAAIVLHLLRDAS